MSSLVVRIARRLERRPLLAFLVTCVVPLLVGLALFAGAFEPAPTWQGGPETEFRVRVRNFAATGALLRACMRAYVRACLHTR